MSPSLGFGMLANTICCSCGVGIYKKELITSLYLLFSITKV
jgi:hypothetical protein